MFMVTTMYKTMKNQYFMVYQMYTGLKEIILYLLLGKKKTTSYGCMRVLRNQSNLKIYQNS